ncbi:MAG: fibronectin type III domain-containing protein, partial [Desulfosarcinaceae bacterium]
MFQDRLRFFTSKNFRWQRGFVYLMAVVIILLLPAASLAASQVTLAWSANSEASLAGYRIYYKSGSSGEPYNGSGIIQGTSPVEIPLSSLADSSNPEVTLTGLAEGTDYYFAATAYDTYGNESGYSNEVVL